MRFPSSLEGELTARLHRRLRMLSTYAAERGGTGPSLTVSAASVLPFEPSSLAELSRAVAAFTTRQVVRVVGKAVGANLAGDRRIPEQTGGLLALRSAWALDVARRVQLLEQDLLSGKPIDARARAALIARDAVGQLMSQVSEVRCRALGVEGYRWSSRGDALVRDSHRKLAGTVRRWDDPHPTEGHPGDAFGCRCVAVPVLRVELEEPAAPELAPSPLLEPAPAPAPVPAAPPTPPALDLSGVRDLTLFPGIDEEDRVRALRRIFGRDVEPAEILSWTGADPAELSGAKQIDLRLVGQSVELVVNIGRFTMTRSYRRSIVTGQLIAKHEFFELKGKDSKGKGQGAELFSRQVEALKRAGFSKISTNAAGPGGNLNGYYSWPRLGYDGEIPRGFRELLPPELASAQRLSDLMKTQAGRDWWKANGGSVDVDFDLQPGSLSLRVLEEYLAEKANAPRLDSVLRLDAATERIRPAEEIELTEQDLEILDGIWDRIAQNVGGQR